MRRRVALSLLACLLVAVGCAVDQKKEVETYRKVVDIPTTAPATDFTSGQPLTLRRALLLTNAANERLSIEGETYLQSIIDRRRAAAAFLPTVNLAPTYTFRDTGSGSNDNANTSSTARKEIFDVPVEGTINVFNGFSDVARLKSTKLTIEQRRALLLDFQEQLLLDVARVYYQVLRAEESVRVLENSLQVQDERLRDVRGRQIRETEQLFAHALVRDDDVRRTELRDLRRERARPAAGGERVDDEAARLRAHHFECARPHRPGRAQHGHAPGPRALGERECAPGGRRRGRDVRRGVLWRVRSHGR